MKETEVNYTKLSQILTTNTTKLILPYLSIDKNLLAKEDTGFINGYISDINRPWLEDKIILAYKTGWKVNKIKDILKSNENYYSSYYTNMNNESYDMFVYNVPVGHKQTIASIKNGCATLLDESSKDYIIDFWGNNEYNIRNDIRKKNKYMYVDNDYVGEATYIPSIGETLIP